jgi:hypothetical protein
MSGGSRFTLVSVTPVGCEESTTPQPVDTDVSVSQMVLDVTTQIQSLLSKINTLHERLTVVESSINDASTK